MRFTKLQGLGNDFVLIDSREDSNHNWAGLAQRMCVRRFGVGADGLLVLLDSESAKYRMRMFNPDGSEAEACGNGLRCLVCYMASQGLIQQGDGSPIETMAGIRQATLLEWDGRAAQIMVSMGKPVFQTESLPVAVEAGKGNMFDIMLGNYPLTVSDEELRLNFVSMGNPHAVYFIPGSVSEFPLSTIGPKVEHNPLFPRGVNFEIVHMISPHRCEMRVWERGAGETLACGSGACAVAVAARLSGIASDTLEISLPGGLAEVSWDGQGEVLLTGPAESVFCGEWPDALDA